MYDGLSMLLLKWIKCHNYIVTNTPQNLKKLVISTKKNRELYKIDERDEDVTKKDSSSLKALEIGLVSKRKKIN